MDNLIEIYVNVDDFLKIFQSELNKKLLQHVEKIRNRSSRTSRSELITVIILFHRSNYRTFKHFYLNHVYKYLQQDFPTLLSYTQFVKLQKTILIHICAYLNSIKSKQTDISFIDSTPIAANIDDRKVLSKLSKGLTGKLFGDRGYIYHINILTYYLNKDCILLPPSKKI